MSNTIKKKLNISFSSIIRYFFVILWMTTIFIFSAMDHDASENLSESTTQIAIEKILSFTNSIGLTDKHPSKERVYEVVITLQLLVRKFAHMFLYFVLTLIVLFTLPIKDLKKRMLVALLICFLYACTDEFHQLFVPGRTGAFIDCLIDTLGGIVGCITFLVILKAKKEIT